ncbi:hypothetical protein BD410DRAFT_824764 [Rickenella mellea]|uniref:Uncharacterized protein n=1 Tax=Rickenella mellea TaxID=50990 RepID=A0A4Y7QL86_9AGAM|nr:hypothetical protein BD410DRAFT_824764 [Rickenella mellea]
MYSIEIGLRAEFKLYIFAVSRACGTNRVARTFLALSSTNLSPSFHDRLPHLVFAPPRDRDSARWRLKTRFPAARGSKSHRLFLSAFTIASTVVSDDAYSNKGWAMVGLGVEYLEWHLNGPGEDLEEFEKEVRHRSWPRALRLAPSSPVKLSIPPYASNPVYSRPGIPVQTADSSPASSEASLPTPPTTATEHRQQPKIVTAASMHITHNPQRPHATDGSISASIPVSTMDLSMPVGHEKNRLSIAALEAKMAAALVGTVVKTSTSIRAR